MKCTTIRELETFLAGWPEGLKDGPVNLTFFNPNGPVGQRALDHHYKPVYVYGDDGELYIQNKEWDDGAS